MVSRVKREEESETDKIRRARSFSFSFSLKNRGKRRLMTMRRAKRRARANIIITCGTRHYPCVESRTGEPRPTQLAVFAAFRSSTAWPSHVKIFRASERACECARLRYQENRCSTSAGAIRPVYDRRRLTRRPTVRLKI